MTTFLVFVAVLASGAVALAATGLPDSRFSRVLPGARPSRRSAAGAAVPADPGLAEPDPRLPPVLLPEDPQPSDIGRLRFSVGLRGYRMDQVDAVLDRLATALAERDAAVAERDAALAAAPRPPAADPGPPGQA